MKQESSVKAFYHKKWPFDNAMNFDLKSDFRGFLFYDGVLFLRQQRNQKVSVSGNGLKSISHFGNAVVKQ